VNRSIEFPAQRTVLLNSLLNTQEHLSLHNEMRRLEDDAPEQKIEQSVLEIRIEVTASADDQTR